MSVRLSESEDEDDEVGPLMTMDDADAAALGIMPPMEKEGWMQKRGGKNPAYKKRYFVLRNKVLKYYKNQKDLKPKGKVMLQGCEVHPLPHNGKNEDVWEFSVKSNIFSRVYMFCTSSDALRNAWIAALESHIKWDEDRAEATLKAAREAKENDERKSKDDQVSDLLSESLENGDSFLTTADRHRIGSMMPSPFAAKGKGVKSAFAIPNANKGPSLHLDISDEFLGMVASASKLDRMDGWRRNLSRRGIDDSFAQNKDHIRMCRKTAATGFSNATALDTHNKRNWFAVSGNDAGKQPLLKSSKVRLMTAIESKYDPRSASYSLLSMEEMYHFEVDSKIVADVSWHGDNLLVAGDQGRVMLFDYPSKPEDEDEEVDEAPLAVFHHRGPDGKTIVGSDGDGSFADPCPGKPIDSTVVRAVAACPGTGNQRFLSLINNHMFVWDMEREQAPLFHDGSAFRALRACAWNPHQTSQFVVGGHDRSLRVLDLRVDAKSHSGAVGAVWEVSEAHHDYIRDVSWSPLARPWIATASEDGSVKVWDIRYIKNTTPVTSLDGGMQQQNKHSTNVANRVLAAHASAVNCVNWSLSHCQYLLSGSVDGTLKLWDLRASPHFVGYSHVEGTSCVVGCAFSSTHPFQYFCAKTDGSMEGHELGQPFLAGAALDTEYASLSAAAATESSQESTEQVTQRMHTPVTPQATPEAKVRRGSRWSGIKLNVAENIETRKRGSSIGKLTPRGRSDSFGLRGLRSGSNQDGGGSGKGGKPNALARLKARQKAQEVDAYLYVRDYHKAYKAIIELCNMFLLYDSHADAAMLFELIDERRFSKALVDTDSAESGGFSFTELLLKLSSSFVKHGLSLTLPETADVDRLAILRLRMRLNQLMDDGDSDALFGLEEEILKQIAKEGFGTPDDSQTLVSVTEVLLRHDHLRAMRFARKLGQTLQTKGNFQFFFPIAVLLFTPTVFTEVVEEKKAPGLRSPLASFLKKNTDVRKADSAGKSPLAAFMRQNIGRVSLAVHAQQQNRSSSAQPEVLLDELREPNTLFGQLDLFISVLSALSATAVNNKELNAWNPFQQQQQQPRLSESKLERVLRVPRLPLDVADKVVEAVEDYEGSPEDMWKVFPACLHRLYLTALSVQKDFAQLFVVATNLVAHLKVQSELCHQVKSMFSDASVPAFQQWLQTCCEEEEDEQKEEQVSNIEDASEALIAIVKILHSCAQLPTELEYTMPQHLEALGKRLYGGLSDMREDRRDARGAASRLLKEIEEIQSRGRQRHRNIAEFDEEMQQVTKLVRSFT